MALSSEELRWAIDHNAAVTRAFETKSQIYMGMTLLFFPLANDNVGVLDLDGRVAALVYGLFAVAALCHLRVILPVASAKVRESGQTPVFADARRMTLGDFVATLRVASTEILGTELYKVQIIRDIKAGRFAMAHALTVLAIVVLLGWLLVSLPPVQRVISIVGASIAAAFNWPWA